MTEIGLLPACEANLADGRWHMIVRIRVATQPGTDSQELMRDMYGHHLAHTPAQVPDEWRRPLHVLGSP